MSAKPIQLYRGEQSTRAAEAYRRAVLERRERWPYVHTFAPPNAVDVNVIGTIACQAQGAAAIEVLFYQVNSGKRFYLQAVLLSANVTFVPGDALFTVDRNSPVGVTGIQAMPEHGFIAVPVALGSATFGPWKLQRAREFAPLSIVRVKATNINLNAGTDYYVCGLFGYEVPVLDVISDR